MATLPGAVNVAEVRVFEGEAGNGVPTPRLHFSAYLDRYNASIGLVDDQMTWIENLLGPYPFEVYGHAAIDQSGAALETQTMVVMPPGDFVKMC